jgi:putative glutathione S-transferase
VLDAAGGAPGLRAAYEAARHHYDGPLAVPALCDRWSGRVVSNHTPHILDDLALRLADPGLPRLRPAALAADIDGLRLLVEDGTAEPLLLDLLECRLAGRPYVLGPALTAADVDVWAAIATVPERDGNPLAGRPRLAAWYERLGAHPAFAAATRQPAPC